MKPTPGRKRARPEPGPDRKDDAPPPGPASRNRPTEETHAPTVFHSVRDTCRMLGLEPHVLRYWEREFDIKVKRNSAGRRIYSEAQVEKLRLIRRLIRDERLTVKGTKKKLAQMRTSPQQSLDFADLRLHLPWVRKELIAIRGLLEPQEPGTGKKKPAARTGRRPGSAPSGS